MTTSEYHHNVWCDNIRMSVKVQQYMHVVLAVDEPMKCNTDSDVDCNIRYVHIVK